MLSHCWVFNLYPRFQFPLYLLSGVVKHRRRGGKTQTRDSGTSLYSLLSLTFLSPISKEGVRAFYQNPFYFISILFTLQRKPSLYFNAFNYKLSDLKWKLKWIWNGLPLLLFYKLLLNLLDLLICPNLWIISMKKLWGFTRDSGQKEVM